MDNLATQKLTSLDQEIVQQTARINTTKTRLQIMNVMDGGGNIDRTVLNGLPDGDKTHAQNLIDRLKSEQKSLRRTRNTRNQVTAYRAKKDELFYKISVLKGIVNPSGSQRRELKLAQSNLTAYTKALHQLTGEQYRSYWGRDRLK